MLPRAWRRKAGSYAIFGALPRSRDHSPSRLLQGGYQYRCHCRQLSPSARRFFKALAFGSPSDMGCSWRSLLCLHSVRTRSHHAGPCPRCTAPPCLRTDSHQKMSIMSLLSLYTSTRALAATSARCLLSCVAMGSGAPSCICPSTRTRMPTLCGRPGRTHACELVRACLHVQAQR